MIFGTWAVPATWTLSVISIGLVVVALVVLIVNKIEKEHNWRKASKVLYCLIGVFLFKIFLLYTYYHYRDERVATVNTQSQTRPVKIVQPKGIQHWKLPDGQYLNGRNETPLDQETVDITLVSPTEIRAELHYVEYGSPERQRIRLVRTSYNTWEGNCDQDKPNAHGRLNLIEPEPGTYSGMVNWGKDGEGKDMLATYYFRVEK